MLKDFNLAHKTIVDFIKTQLLLHQKQGVVIHLDGTLQSLVNVHIAKSLGDAFTYKVIICTHSSNHQYLKHRIAMVQDLDIVYEVKDLQKDFETLSPYLYSNGDLTLEIAHKKCLIDLMLNLEASKHNLIPLSNMSYSQWLINYPHPIYKNLAHIHPLARFFQSEIVTLAHNYGISKILIERSPSHYLYRGQLDEAQLGYTYQALEDLIRTSTITSSQDTKIQQSLVPDNRELYMIPTIQRPSNILG